LYVGNRGKIERLVLSGTLGQKKGAEMEISARINPISYEKPYYKR